MTTAAGVEIQAPKHTKVVRLRNGLTATTWLCVSFGSVAKPPQPLPFPILGIDSEGFAHAWRFGGHWSQTDNPHPFDIVAE